MTCSLWMRIYDLWLNHFFLGMHLTWKCQIKLRFNWILPLTLIFLDTFLLLITNLIGVLILLCFFLFCIKAMQGISICMIWDFCYIQLTTFIIAWLLIWSQIWRMPDLSYFDIFWYSSCPINYFYIIMTNDSVVLNGSWASILTNSCTLWPLIIICNPDWHCRWLSGLTLSYSDNWFWIIIFHWHKTLVFLNSCILLLTEYYFPIVYYFRLLLLNVKIFFLFWRRLLVLNLTWWWKLNTCFSLRDEGSTTTYIYISRIRKMLLVQWMSIIFLQFWIFFFQF